jgi:outer membrane protein OmpA-like peptidoglycan-associated protein
LVWGYLLCHQPNIKDIHSAQATNCVGIVKNHSNEKSYFIFFESGKSDIQSTQIQNIYKALAESECFKNYHIEISGYTDTQGTSSNNKKLAMNRAERVKDYLVRSGVLKDKIKFFTKEEIGRPITTEDNFSEKLNRRVEIRIISQPDSVKKKAKGA